MLKAKLIFVTLVVLLVLIGYASPLLSVAATPPIVYPVEWVLRKLFVRKVTAHSGT